MSGAHLSLLELQLALNSEREEELIRGLDRATNLILKEHGLDCDVYEAALLDLGARGDPSLETWGERDSHGGYDEDGDGDEDGDEDEEEEDELDQEGEGDVQGQEEEDQEDDGADLDETRASADMEDIMEDDRGGGEVNVGQQIRDNHQEVQAVPVKGLLKEYLDSSPEVAELLRLWALEQRRSWRRVAEKHTLMLAAVLLCLRGTQARQGPLICRRLLSDYASDLHLQLISNQQSLATASICLLTSLARFSGSTARELLMRVSLVSKPVLHLFAPTSGKIARRMSVGLVASLLSSRDVDVVSRVLGNERLLSAVSKSLPSDDAPVVLVWLSALHGVLAHPRVPFKAKRRLFTFSRLDQLRRLYQRRGDNAMEDGSVVEAVDGILRRALSSAKEGPGLFRSSAGSDARSWALVRLLLNLSTSDDFLQRRLALDVLQQYPWLSASYMRRLSQSWESRPTFDGLASFSFLASLLQTLPLPPPSILYDMHYRGISHQAAEAAEGVLASVLPSGLGKRELTKALLSHGALLQRAGLILTIQILGRVTRAMASLPPSVVAMVSLRKAVRLGLAQRLPEMQSLLAVRGRWNAESNDQEKDVHLYTLLIVAIRRYHEVVPEAVEGARFDFLRLVTDRRFSSLPAPLVLELLRLLKALGPRRLQWLPADPQAWSSGKAPVATAMTHLLNLLLVTRHEELRQEASALVSSIACYAGGPGPILTSALLLQHDNCGQEMEEVRMEASVFFEFSLRLVANQPYAFRLMALRSGLSTKVSAIVPALLFLVGGKGKSKEAQGGIDDEEGSEEEEGELRAAFQGFGLNFDRLRGRFAGSTAALAITRYVVMEEAVASGLTAEETKQQQRALESLMAQIGGKSLASGLFSTGGEGRSPARKEDLQRARRRVESLLTAATSRAKPIASATVEETIKVMNAIVGLGPDCMAREPSLMNDAMVAVLRATQGDAYRGLLMNFLRESKASIIDAFSSDVLKSAVLGLLPLPFLMEVMLAGGVSKSKAEDVLLSSSQGIRRAVDLAELRSCAACLVHTLGAIHGGLEVPVVGRESWRQDFQLELMVVIACRAWQLEGRKGVSEVLAALVEQVQQRGRLGDTACMGLSCMCRAFLPTMLKMGGAADGAPHAEGDEDRSADGVSKIRKWAEEVLLNDDMGNRPLSGLSGLLLSPSMQSTEKASLARRALLVLSREPQGHRAARAIDSAAWARVVLDHLLIVSSGAAGAAMVESLMSDGEAASAVGALWRVSLAADDGDDQFGCKFAALVHVVLASQAAAAVGAGAAWMDLASPEAVTWCWRTITATAVGDDTASLLLMELCKASELCCTTAAELLRDSLLGSDSVLWQAPTRALLMLGPGLAVVVSRVALEDGCEELLRKLAEKWLEAMAVEQTTDPAGDGIPVERLESMEKGLLVALQACLDRLSPMKSSVSNAEGGGYICERLASRVAAILQSKTIAVSTSSLRCASLTILVRWCVTRDPGQVSLMASLIWKACNEARQGTLDDPRAERALSCLRSLVLSAEMRPFLPRAAVEASGAAVLTKSSVHRGGRSSPESLLQEVTRLAAASAHVPVRAAGALEVVHALLVAFVRDEEENEDNMAMPILESLLRSDELEQSLRPPIQPTMLRLLLWLFSRVVVTSRARAGEIGEVLLPYLVSAYRGTMAETDLLILRLWRLLSEHAEVPLKVASSLCVGESTTRLNCAVSTSPPSVRWVIDIQLVYKTMESFPLDRPLFPPRTKWEHQIAGQEVLPIPSIHHGADQIYDPAFILPLIDAVLRERESSVRDLLSSGMIALAMVAMASRQKGVRLCACSCLQHMAQLLEAAPRADAAAKERPQLALLLRLLASSISPALDPLPYSLALFLARASHVMGSPANDLYVAINTYLVRRLELEHDLPLFYELFFSSRPFHRRELVWVLRLMADSIKTQEDLVIYRRRHYFSLLLSFLDGLANSGRSRQPTAADGRLLSLGLGVVGAAAALPGAAEHLVCDVGLLAWSNGMLAGLAPSRNSPTAASASQHQVVMLLETVAAVVRALLQSDGDQTTTIMQTPSRWDGRREQATVLVHSLLALFSQWGVTSVCKHGQACQRRSADAERLIRAGVVALDSLSQLLGGLELTLGQVQDILQIGRSFKDSAEGRTGRRTLLNLLLKARDDPLSDEEQPPGAIWRISAWAASVAAECLEHGDSSPLDILTLCSATGAWLVKVLEQRMDYPAAESEEASSSIISFHESPFTLMGAVLRVLVAVKDYAAVMTEMEASHIECLDTWIHALLSVIPLIQFEANEESLGQPSPSAVLGTLLREARSLSSDRVGRRRSLRRLAHQATFLAQHLFVRKTAWLDVASDLKRVMASGLKRTIGSVESKRAAGDASSSYTTTRKRAKRNIRVSS